MIGDRGSVFPPTKPQSQKKKSRIPPISLTGPLSAAHSCLPCAQTSWQIMSSTTFISISDIDRSIGKPAIQIHSAYDVIDVINIMMVWCREIRVETGRCDVIPFLRRDVGRSGVE